VSTAFSLAHLTVLHLPSPEVVRVAARPSPSPEAITLPSGSLGPKTFTGSAELNAMVARVVPAILGLLVDGPRSEVAIL